MSRIRFPDPNLAAPSGLLAVGGDWNPETILEAYRNGIFPWPQGSPDEPDFEPEWELAWFSPPRRAVLEWENLHISKSLKKARKLAEKDGITFTFDRAFRDVISLCGATPRPGQGGTWITKNLNEAYTTLHTQGYAHSVEAWSGTHLVGGLYGLAVDGYFSAESMFFKRPDASKLCLLHLVEHLHTRGLEWIDIQVMTPHLKALGASTISRERFLVRLAQTRATALRLF